MDNTISDFVSGAFEKHVTEDREGRKRTREWTMKQVLEMEFRGMARKRIAQELQYSIAYINQLMSSAEYLALRAPYIEQEKEQNEQWLRRIDLIAHKAFDEIETAVIDGTDISDARLKLLQMVFRMAGKGEITRSQGKIDIEHKGEVSMNVIHDMVIKDNAKYKQVMGKVIDCIPLNTH